MGRKKLKYAFIPSHFRPKVKGEKLDTSFDATTVPTYNLHAPSTKKAVVCLTVRDDASQNRVIEQHTKPMPVVFLAYDDLGFSWNFSFYQGTLVFYTENEKVDPIGIYHRPYVPPSTHPLFYLFNNLMRVLDVWKGSIVGPGFSHFQNSSKAYQLTTTIREAIKASNTETIDFPQSFFIKGRKRYENFLKNNQDLIVKSCSGIRSEVATEEFFLKWKANRINFLPAFFQTSCKGPDIRIHLFKKHCWGIILHHKEGSIDYRYAKRRGNFEKFELELEQDLKNFCRLCSTIENTSLVGIDFIKVNQKYICLECNPSPGWAGFHRFSGEEPEIAKTLIGNLSHD